MAAGCSRRKGSAIIEFTLIGIPMMFVLISVFEMARGMWLYHTIAYAMKDGTRFAIVRGNNCNVYPNNCVVTVREIAVRIRDAAVGIVPSELQNVVFDAYDQNGNQIAGKQIVCPTLEDCLQPGNPGDMYWPTNPPGAGDAEGAHRFMNLIEISAEFPFRSAIVMFWPGAKAGTVFPTFHFPASSRETIQY